MMTAAFIFFCVIGSFVRSAKVSSAISEVRSERALSVTSSGSIGNQASAMIRKVQRTNNNSRSYVLHMRCTEGMEGIGSVLHRLRFTINLAEQHNLAYVCQPNDFRTGGHATNDMGFLFGCLSDGLVIGDAADIASYTSVAGLFSRDVNEKESHSLFESDVSNRAGVVYRMDSCKHHLEWGDSYKWFRRQYHVARRADSGGRRGSSACQVPGRKSVVVHIRRGDDGKDGQPRRGYTENRYIAVLDKLFRGYVPNVNMTESETHISILAETPENDASIRAFDKFTRSGASVAYFLGSPATDGEQARTRVVRDLDCMSLSDVLVESDGSFSALGAAVQSNGVALMITQNAKIQAGGLDNTFAADSHAGLIEGALKHSTSCIHFDRHDELPNALVASPCEQRRRSE